MKHHSIAPTTRDRRHQPLSPVISRVRRREVAAADNALVLSVGLDLPASAPKGRSARHRALATQAFSDRLDQIFRARFCAMPGVDIDAVHADQVDLLIPMPAYRDPQAA